MFRAKLGRNAVQLLNRIMFTTAHYILFVQKLKNNPHLLMLPQNLLPGNMNVKHCTIALS